jgi:hypothetical protein
VVAKGRSSSRLAVVVVVLVRFAIVLVRTGGLRSDKYRQYGTVQYNTGKQTNLVKKTKMFRATKKKPRKVTIRASIEDLGLDQTEGSEEHDPTVVVRRSKSKKKKSKLDPNIMNTVVRSFDVVEVEEESQRSKKRRRKGLGFGGTTRHVDDDDDVDDDEETKISEETIDTKARSYGKEALDQLKAEQRKPKPKETIAEPGKCSDSLQAVLLSRTPTVDDSSLEIPPHQNPVVSSSTSSLPAFVPLTSGKDVNQDVTAVLTGEEAIRLHEQSESETNVNIKPFLTTGKSKDAVIQESYITDESPDTAWEDLITRRAGLHRSNTSIPSLSSSSQVPLLATLRPQLQSTLSNLKAQQQDLKHAIMRREAEKAQTESNLKRHQESLHRTGDACSEYQKLRHDLAMWVGALRDLQQKVQPIAEALTQMILSQSATAQQEWIHWQDDAASVLQEAGKLDQVLGRQPALPPPSHTSTAKTNLVDEFGRDSRSQYLRKREKRYRRRLQRRGLAPKIDHDGEKLGQSLWRLWVEEEDLDTLGRYHILQEALRVAFNDLDDDFTSIDKLLGVFERWKESYPDEYRQCYASLSLGDLVSVLAQADFCRSSWVSSMLRPSESMGDNERTDEFLWVPKLQSADIHGQEEEEGAIQRVLGKKFVPLLLTILNDSPALCFFSSEWSHLANDVVKNSDEKSEIIKELNEALFKATIEVLDSVSIPLVKDELNKLPDIERKEEVDHAVNFSKVEQSIWIQQLLLNLLADWVPFLRCFEKYEEVGKSILDFISGKYLFLLSSLAPCIASDMFAPVWKILKTENSDWLESPSFILQGAPVRAAASVYGL